MYSRSKKVQKEYNEIKKTLNKDECFICEKELFVKEFKYWVLLRNRFPYSIKFLWFYIPLKNHYILCPKRHINNRKLTTENENAEYIDILLDFKEKGHTWMWNTKEESSFKYHIHCQIMESWFKKFLHFLKKE